MSQLPLTGGYYAYFAAGAVFGIVRTQRDKLAVLSLLVALFLCMDYSSGMAPSLSVNRGVSYSSLVIGMIIAAQFMFFVFLTSARGSSMRLPGSKLAGALTYPVYLVHAHFGYMFLSRFGNDQNRLPIYCLTVALVLVVAYLIHVLVERRLASVWRRLFWSVAGRPIDAVAKRLYAISAIR
jgi:peptidoglycan/LPS O-acetylase OafA/YrhL